MHLTNVHSMQQQSVDTTLCYVCVLLQAGKLNAGKQVSMATIKQPVSTETCVVT